MEWHRMLAIGWLLLAIVLQCRGEMKAEPAQHLQAGPLGLDLYVSKTAHLFHVVDQISQWSEFCHRQYVDYFENQEGGLSGEDRRLLQQHVEVRRKHGWSRGLEQAFYTPLELEAALARAIDQEMLKKDEVDAERRILVHFQPRVERLLSEQGSVLSAFKQNLVEKELELTRFANTLSRFVGAKNLAVPVYLVANPDRHSIGGGYNGGRLTLEIAAERDVYPSLLHELFHAFVRTAQEKLEYAAQTTSGLDTETLDEGLAYAYSPGLMHAAGSDPLLAVVGDYVQQDSRLSDSYTRFNTYGLALRPLLKEALWDKPQALEAFLPRAIDAWQVLVGLEKARTLKPQTQLYPYRKDSGRTIFVFGIWDEQANQSFSKICRNIFGRAHTRENYEKMLVNNSKPGDTVVLLLSLDDFNARVPKEFSDLLPLPWPAVENRLRKNEIIFTQGKAREMTVFLLATPTIDDLHREFRRLAAGKRFNP